MRHLNKIYDDRDYLLSLLISREGKTSQLNFKFKVSVRLKLWNKYTEIFPPVWLGKIDFQFWQNIFSLLVFFWSTDCWGINHPNKAQNKNSQNHLRYTQRKLATKCDMFRYSLITYTKIDAKIENLQRPKSFHKFCFTINSQRGLKILISDKQTHFSNSSAVFVTHKQSRTSKFKMWEQNKNLYVI